VALILLSNFKIVIAFGHSAFITSQLMLVPMNIVLKRYLACRTFSKCQPYSNGSCLSICTCDGFDASHCLHWL